MKRAWCVQRQGGVSTAAAVATWFWLPSLWTRVLQNSDCGYLLGFQGEIFETKVRLFGMILARKAIRASVNLIFLL
jgi:hypothetical protein